MNIHFHMHATIMAWDALMRCIKFMIVYTLRGIFPLFVKLNPLNIWNEFILNRVNIPSKQCITPNHALDKICDLMIKQAQSEEKTVLYDAAIEIQGFVESSGRDDIEPEAFAVTVFAGFFDRLKEGE